MGIFRGIIIGFLVLWLTLPMPLFFSPEMVGDGFKEQPMVNVLLHQQKAKSSILGFWHQLKKQSKSFQGIKPTLLMRRIMFDDLGSIKESIEVTLFYFWQTLIKPTRQILWQMTSQMQRFLIKNLGWGYYRNKFILSFEDLIYPMEIVLDPEIS